MGQCNRNLRESNMIHPKRDLKDMNFKNINSLQINRWCLKPIAAWPLTSTSSTIEKLMALVIIVFWSLTIAIVTIPCILYVLLEDSDIATKLGAVGPLLHRIMGSLSYWMLLKRRHNILNCIQHMDIIPSWYAKKYITKGTLF